MAAWVCPKCKRQFARAEQGHMCAPAMTLEEYFATGPQHERAIFEAILARLTDAGPVHVEPVAVGLFLKRARSFAELRPRDKWVNLSFSVPYAIDSPRIRSRIPTRGGRTYYVVRLQSPADVDEHIERWLLDAYFDSPPP
ncbi:MAG: hypothetical protein JO247_01315 [Chloroflexi bacterium]|nr:hypothetical protein [Chloroflexota bacterium]